MGASWGTVSKGHHGGTVSKGTRGIVSKRGNVSHIAQKLVNIWEF